MGVRARTLEPGKMLRQRSLELRDLNELEVCARSADNSTRLAPGAVTIGGGIEVEQHGFRATECVEHRAREQPVEQQELERLGALDAPAVGAKIRLVRRAAAQRGHP